MASRSEIAQPARGGSRMTVWLEARCEVIFSDFSRIGVVCWRGEDLPWKFWTLYSNSR